VNGGSAADTLTAAGANDVLNGGAGNDTLKVTGGIASAVTLTGGAGVDSFDVSGFTAANAGAAVTITDFTKGETIKFVANASANFASSKVVLIAEATFDNYVTEAAKAADAVSAGTHGVAWFQFGTNTFVVQDVNGGAEFNNGDDVIVKLTGLVDLSASSFNEAGQGTLLFI
jgi:S-layer protein